MSNIIVEVSFEVDLFERVR